MASTLVAIKPRPPKDAPRSVTGLPQDSTRISQGVPAANITLSWAAYVVAQAWRSSSWRTTSTWAVIREFDSYYQLKLGRPPKLLGNETTSLQSLQGVYERRRGAARAAARRQRMSAARGGRVWLWAF